MKSHSKKGAKGKVEVYKQKKFVACHPSHSHRLFLAELRRKKVESSRVVL